MYTGLAGILFVPIYLHFLGVESYGLFALLNSYMAVALLLDLGFSAAITREVAKFSEASPERMRDLVWTISVPYCAGTLAIAIGIYFAAPWLASVVVIKSSGLPEAAIVRGIGFAGFALTLQLPIFLYTGGLAGLQRQDLANGVTIASTTLRHTGSIFLLWSFSCSVATLMIWQAAVATSTAAAAFTVLWCQMPSNHRLPRFRIEFLRDIWRFAASIGGVTLLGMVVFQSDKVFIGALLPLKEVGTYMVASVIAANLTLIAQPVSAVAFPRLSQLEARKDIATIRATFHKLSQLVALMLLPLTTVIAFFPQQTLAVWTGNPAVAASAAPVLRILAIGVAFNACICVPYGLVLAAGWTRVLFIMTIITAIVTLPLLYALTAGFGVIGAASAMLAYLVMWFVIYASIIRKLLGSDEWWRWLYRSIVLPAALVAAATFTIQNLVPLPTERDLLFVLLAVTWLVAAIAAGLTMPWLREQALRYLQKLRTRSLRAMS
jgi:O-antigen/teichoic acid export membrane protein